MCKLLNGWFSSNSACAIGGKFTKWHDLDPINMYAQKNKIIQRSWSKINKYSPRIIFVFIYFQQNTNEDEIKLSPRP